MTEVVIHMTGCNNDYDADDESNGKAFLTVWTVFLCVVIREMAQQNANGCTWRNNKNDGVKWFF